jgi:hypothetical protein
MRPTKAELFFFVIELKPEVVVLLVCYPTLTGRSSPNSDAKWCKPEPRQVKINVDASFYADLHAGSIGAIARDYQGSFIAAKAVYLPHVASLAMAEAIAMREGLSLATSLGCNNIIAESDSMETIQACMGEHSWWNESAEFFADCVDLASLIFFGR